MKMLTIGCSEGRDATPRNTTITNPRIRGLLGNPEYEAIECQNAPKQGRTGGGLFTTDGYLAGVCNFAEPKGDHGLYAVPDSIYRLLDRNHLTFLYADPHFGGPEVDDLIRAADSLTVEGNSTEAQVRHILEEWPRRSSSWKSVDAQFTGHEHSSTWGDDELLDGRVVLVSGGRAFVEIIRGSGQDRTTERIVWTDDTMHQVLPERREHLVWPIDENDRGRLPAILALPFFWKLTAENMKSRYEVELLKEEAGAWFLRITPRSHDAGQSFSRAFLELEQASFLPRRDVLISPDGKSSKHFRITRARCNQEAPRELWQLPDDQGWNVIRGETALIHRLRLLRPDLLP